MMALPAWMNAFINQALGILKQLTVEQKNLIAVFSNGQ